MTVSVRAYAKLNLYLDITGRLENGYHSLNTVTQSVDVYDDIIVCIKPSDAFGCHIRCDNADIPCDSRNTAYKAAELFCKTAGVKADIEISIYKRVPLMGGMGGSSVDAAGVLYAMNLLFSHFHSDVRLYELAAQIGADVPICLAGGTLASEKESRNLHRINCSSDCFFVCVYPDFTLNTREAFRLYDVSPTKSDNGFERYISQLKAKGILGSGGLIKNSFTELHKDERIYRIKSELKACGARASELTGSGSVVYGIFRDGNNALNAKQRLCERFPRVFVCKSVDCGVKSL